ncbi:hypothetical protein AYI70_g8655 [Smittium culicis]|uniref:Uncharacterized protein n=1 Tax=Smittium culicis TaxID=133412 RepID=A0A1R1XEX8_9FUNG|nr:hypothetical protein AYI70_g8655 [Smittium culicis]
MERVTGAENQKIDLSGHEIDSISLDQKLDQDSKENKLKVKNESSSIKIGLETNISQKNEKSLSEMLKYDRTLIREPIISIDVNNLKYSNARKSTNKKLTLEEKMEKVKNIRDKMKKEGEKISEQYFTKFNEPKASKLPISTEETESVDLWLASAL